MSNVMVAQFNGHSETPPLRALTVIQKIGKHSLAMLDYDTVRASLTLPQENVATSIRWGNSPSGLNTFYGYVNHYETVTVADGVPHTRVYVLGTSKPMNNVVPTNWNRVTYSSVARDIARRYGLRSVINPHPFVAEAWAGGRSTDFQILQRLVDETGYFLWVDGSTLYFLDPERMITNGGRLQHPQFVGEQIRLAKVTAGAGAPKDSGAAKRRIVYGLDYTNNEFFESQSGSLDNPTEVLDRTVLTYAEAQSLNDATARMNQDYYLLDARVDGNAQVAPCTVATLSSNTLNDTQTGMWAVQTAEHYMEAADFVTKFTAIRNSTLQPTVKAPATLRGSQQVSATVRNRGRWEAVRQEHLNV